MTVHSKFNPWTFFDDFSTYFKVHDVQKFLIFKLNSFIKNTVEFKLNSYK